MPAAATTTIPTPKGYELRLGLFGHGWIELPTNTWDEDSGIWATALRLNERIYRADISSRKRGQLQLELTGQRRPGRAVVAAAVAAIRHMLRFDDDLAEFYAACRDEPGLAWVPRRGAGRLLRSQSVFEDLMKLLFTTNTTWAGTVAMTRNLADHRGPEGPNVRAFPNPAECLASESFYRDTVRTGYRATAARELAKAFAGGELDDATFLAPQPTDQLRQRLLGLRGFGPYAVGQAMRLLGHYDDLALDSWCRARLAQLAGRKKPASDRTIERRYARFGRFAGLALWLELTAEWHGEGRMLA
ncbi:MAG: Fe-S cluster assembly protein HesB [bacterium]|nr:Fe-S cluster assembly protein HesB [bacterium]